MLTRLIRTDNGICIAKTSSILDRWDWILEVMTDEFKCWPDDVDGMENAEGEELITIRGEPTAKIEYSFGWRT